jgi:tRNA-dihydrouridine synthase B
MIIGRQNYRTTRLRDQSLMMKLGSLQLSGNLFLAPMSGLTDYPFRRLAKEHGCCLVFTEMVSAEGLLRKGKSFLKIVKDEHPISVQLFGSNPEVMAKAAQMAEATGVDAIDINMGCPAKQVVKTGAGADLMRFPEKVKEILIEVRKRVKSPLTIKIRSGWDRQHINAVEISRIAVDSGIDAIFVHPRTKDQGFCGGADWDLIGKVKKAVRIPVVGNGDVTTPLLARKMLEETGCDGVMIGRGALGNPWIFDPKHLGFSAAQSVIQPSFEERERTIEYHFSLLQEHYGEKGAMREIRKHASRYTKGLPSGVFFRSALPHLRGSEEFFETLTSYFESIKNISARDHSYSQGSPAA